MTDFFAQLFLTYPALAPILFVVVRAVAIIIPPIPGVLIDTLGILMFGWAYGLVLGESGVLIGSLGSFWLARSFREPLVGRITSLRKVEVWEERYSERQKFWGLVGIRLVAIPLFDYISYAAGLTKIKWRTFILSTLLGTLPVMFAFYYFGEAAFNKGVYFGIACMAGLLLLYFVYKKTDLLGRLSTLWESGDTTKEPGNQSKD